MTDKIAELTEILPYVREFQGKTFVIKLGGEVLDGSLQDLAKQISLIHHIGIKVVLVHGGGPQLNELCHKLDIKVNMVEGRRVTDAQTLEAAKMLYRGSLNMQVVTALQAQGANAVGLSGADGFIIRARKRVPVRIGLEKNSPEVDFGFVGDVERVNADFLTLLLSNGYLPIIAPLAISEKGEILNVNADTISSSIAVQLGASKLIMVSNVPGILRNKDEPASLVSYTDSGAVQEMISAGTIAGGMKPKAQACLAALNGGVPRTHIISGGRRGSLLEELFLNQGTGTMIVLESEKERYEALFKAA